MTFRLPSPAAKYLADYDATVSKQFAGPQTASFNLVHL